MLIVLGFYKAVYDKSEHPLLITAQITIVTHTHLI